MEQHYSVSSGASRCQTLFQPGPDHGNEAKSIPLPSQLCGLFGPVEYDASILMWTEMDNGPADV